MDLLRAIRELDQERQRLDAVIAKLEGMLDVEEHPQPAKRRGRKRMTSAERRVVAQRMREYWAKKRASNGEQATQA